MIATSLRSGIDALAALQAQVCVVGSGPVGLALATDLARRGCSVVLLESGGVRPSATAATLSEACIETPDSHAPTALTLCRAFGGNAWLWGGRCVPLDPVDFISHASDPERHWPISYEDIARYYAAAAEFLDCGAPEFALPRSHGIEFGTAAATDLEFERVERWCAEPIIPLRRKMDVLPPGLQVVTGATAVDLECDDGKVTAVTVAEPGRRHAFKGAAIYVLACGGLETTRLLLAAQRHRPAMFGGDEGPLGCYYMGHVSGHPTRIQFDHPAIARHFRYRDDGGAVVRARITLGARTQVEQGLPNVAFWPFNPDMADPAHGNGLLSLVFLMLSIPGLGRHFISEAIRQMQLTENPRYMAHIRNILRDLPRVARQSMDLLWQKFGRKRRKPFFFLESRDGIYPLHFHAEHLPHRQNRVALSKQCDPLGSPRLSIEFRFSERDAEGVVRSHVQLDAALRRSGVGRLLLDASEAGLVQLRQEILRQARDGFSQIGLTRMGRNDRDGVVDSDCKVFGLENLFVAGSSVFRSSGQANPMLPSVALALRLAAHIERKLSPVTGTGVVT